MVEDGSSRTHIPSTGRQSPDPSPDLLSRRDGSRYSSAYQIPEGAIRPSPTPQLCSAVQKPHSTFTAAKALDGLKMLCPCVLDARGLRSLVLVSGFIHDHDHRVVSSTERRTSCSDATQMEIHTLAYNQSL